MPEEEPENGSGPLIQLGAGQRAPVISYDVPQPAEYTGRNYIELEFDDDVWSAGAFDRPEADLPPRPRDGGGTGGSGGGSDDGEFDVREELDRLEEIEKVIAFGNSPGGIPPEEWLRFAADFAGGRTIVRPDGGVETGDRETPADEVVLAPGSERALGSGLVLPADDRHRLSEALFEHGGFETIAQSRPELLPVVFEALAIPAGTSEADERSPGSEQLGTGAEAGTRARSGSGAGATPTLRELIPEGSAYASLIDRYSEPVVVEAIDEGWRIRERLDFTGEVVYDLSPPASGATPRLALVETYRLSSFLGDYGAGRTIQTFSLLPGERHEISVRTYRNSKRTSSEASSILDSYEEETAEEFGEQLHDENARKDNETENFSYHAEAKAEAGWGWGSAEVSGGVAGGSTAARESFAKNVASTTSKHAARAASKRDVQVNTTSEESVETGEERSVTRSIENINLSRTLNFVFRQMNQEFVSLLHLVDARVAFHNGDKSAYREVSLHELDRLLEEVVDPAHHDEVRRAIWESLYFVFDHEGEHVPLVERRELVDENGDPLAGFEGEPLLDPETGEPPSYWRVPSVRSTYRDGGDRESSGLPIAVDGVILRATVVTLPTDGVIVEALLGQGEALDDYSSALQNETVREKRVASDRVAADVELEALRRRVVETDDDEAAELLAVLYSDPGAAADDTDDGSGEPIPVEG